MFKLTLTAQEVENLYKFCKDNDNKNIVILTEPHGIGETTFATTQEQWLEKNIECNKTDITDYESW